MPVAPSQPAYGSIRGKGERGQDCIGEDCKGCKKGEVTLEENKCGLGKGARTQVLLPLVLAHIQRPVARVERECRNKNQRPQEQQILRAGRVSAQ